ncbi:MAG TPA: cytochrome c biogenesis CcdA family protein [Anaerolineales bacterium]|nr:cytochrome c biogenesis CcdA family protein [Anaerolineales bacterium]
MDFGILVAFGAGVLSFLSPCVFPLIPAYLAQLTGTSFQELQEMEDNDRRRIMVRNSIAFVVGLAIVFTLFGASATFFGRFFLNNQVLVARIAGFAIVLFGLHMLGVIQIPWLNRESRMDLAEARGRSAGLSGSMLMGAAFGVGWTPCIGPVLASILAIASQADTVLTGMVLLLVYALGLGVPFILMALVLNKTAGRTAMGKIRKYMPQLSAASGALLIFMGLLVFTGNLIDLRNLFTETFGTGLTL